MRRFVLSLVFASIVMVSPAAVSAQEEKFELSVLKTTRTGDALPKGQSRIVFSTVYDGDHWRPNVKRLLLVSQLDVVSYKESAIVTGEGRFMCIDDIIVTGNPRFKKLSMVYASKDKLVFILDGIMRIEALQMLTETYRLTEVGETIVFERVKK